MNNSVYPGVILGDRYHILRQLGQGGFGRTYLAEDHNRFRESCVLKEFAPKVHGTYALQKAQELFEREAGVMYKLQHPQIPRFREMFRAVFNGEGQLFLVQDYIEGTSYRALIDTRKAQGLLFNEAEVTQLLLQLLPVLQYLHSVGVIHRDISPDNLILRQIDGLPVLIDFGGVKQIAASAESQFTSAGVPIAATRLGKVGYAPDEQMLSGEVYPHSDLYALAATVLVLLTGKEPQQLIDPHRLQWNWRSQITLSPKLANILDRMLAHRPGDRFPTANAVLQTLAGNFVVPEQTSAYTQAPPTQATAATLPVNPTYANANTAPQPRQSAWGCGNTLLLLFILAGAGGLGLWAGNTWLNDNISPPVTPTPTDTPSVEPSVEPTPPKPELPAEELRRKEALQKRRQDLKVDQNFLVSWVNQQFYAQNPKLGNRQLTTSPDDADYRAAWDQLATQSLDRLTFLSPEARRNLGKYNNQDIQRRRAQINELNLSSRALNDLTDAQFFSQFPEAKQQNFINQPVGQIWQAIATDYVSKIKNGEAFERLVFAPQTTGKTVSGTLQPGRGKAFIAGVLDNQVLQVNLEAPNQSTLLSFYPPSGQDSPILEDSPEVTWQVSPTQKGFYEFVVINTSEQPIDYQFTINAVTPEPEPKPTPTPTVTPSPAF